MRTSKTECIILRRVNYGDNDRIVSAITPEKGKVSFIAKGVRKEKSKLAGGIELLSVCEISLLKGKSELMTLVSARIKEHFGEIVKNLDRTKIAYSILKDINKTTEDDAGEEYYYLTYSGLRYLNEKRIDPSVVEAWFNIRLLILLGMELNTEFNSKGEKLNKSDGYHFDYENMAFEESENGSFNEKHIKLVRLYGKLTPAKIMKIDDIENINEPVAVLIDNIQKVLLRK